MGMLHVTFPMSALYCFVTDTQTVSRSIKIHVSTSNKNSNVLIHLALEMLLRARMMQSISMFWFIRAHEISVYPKVYIEHTGMLSTPTRPIFSLCPLQAPHIDKVKFYALHFLVHFAVNFPSELNGWKDRLLTNPKARIPTYTTVPQRTYT